MISDALQKWMVVIVIFLGVVVSQIPMMQMPYPMSGPYGPIMMQAPPPPPPPQPIAMPFPVPVPIPIPYTEKTTTTTTTTSRPGEEGGDGDIRIPIAIPLPVPQFVQIAIPGFNSQNCPKGSNKKNGNGNKNCPPCPPCTCNPCTPSFFSYCSPCHQQCRCKNGQENPTPQNPQPPRPLPGPAYPMPIPMPGPAPVVIVPFPPQFEIKEYGDKNTQSSDCDSSARSKSSSTEDSSCESGDNRRKKKRKKNRGKKKKTNYDIYRRNFGFMKRSRNDDKLVRPVLTYMSKDGKVQMRRQLTNDEASVLLGERDSVQNVHLMAGEDSKEQSRVVVMSNRNMGNGHTRRQILLREGMSQKLLGDGKKELVFKPPKDKKITNLSVSFQITR